MEIGVSSMVGIEAMSFEALLSGLAGSGVTAVEVNVGSGYPPTPGVPGGGHLDLAAIVRDGPGAVRELLAKYGSRIASLAPMLNLLTPDPAKRAERIAYLRLALDGCAVLGVPTLVTFTGSAYGMHFSGLPGVGDGHASNHVADNLRIFKEVYEPLADYAGERGVRIAFETAGRGGGEGNLAHAPELWDAMFTAVPSPALGLSFDPSHLVWLGIPNATDLIRAYGSRIYHVDAKDAEILRARLHRQGILGSGWWRYRLPGLGELDWRAILAALVEIGYDDVVSIENEDPVFPGLPGVRWAARHLQACWPP